MSAITMIKAIKEIHTNDVVLFKMGDFYHAYGKDAYIISYLFGYKTKKLQENYSTCGFPTSSLAKNLAKLENNKINYVIVDKRNNYEDDEKQDYKNLNRYEEFFERGHQYVLIRNRIEKIYSSFLQQIEEQNIKNKIIMIEEIIDERRKI